MQELKPLNFFLVLCKTRKKIEKYMKVNKIRNKYIIDIKKMLEEEDISIENIQNSDLLKILILKKFNLAKEKGKDIYYIPYFALQQDLDKVFNIKKILADTHNFNLLYFHEDFEKDKQPEQVLNRVEQFDITQLIQDY
jgi:hypothetical protein